MQTRVRDLVEQGDKLFSARGSLLSLWQSTAEQFYPERADFTKAFNAGDEFASHLMTGMPAMARRDLANQFHAMLRPRSRLWFHPRTLNERVNEDATALKWLDWSGDLMFKVMYERRAQFVRATSQGDHDFATFGQCVIQPSQNATADGLLFRSWHIRDVAWCENASLEVDTVHRDWKIEARALIRLFPKTVSKTVQEAAKKEPYKLIKCRHIVIPSDQYDYTDPDKKPKRSFPFVSIYVDCENDTVLEEVPAPSLGYVIPRWQTVSGSQYAYSPATVIALPDARLLQQITLTLLESGQKAVDPPMIGSAEVIQGGANTYAGGWTWVDEEYDDKQRPIRTLYGDSYGAGLNWGVDREERIMKAVHDAFYLNQISLPDSDGKEMTAYETQKRVEEYIRRALPLFEPMETEYNGALCSEVFDLLLRMNAFGPVDDIPEVLRGHDIRFTFESPLQAATERAKAEAFQQSAGLLKIAGEIGAAGAQHNVDWNKAFRDALGGVGAPSDWMRDEKEVAELAQADAKAAQMAQVAQAIGGAAQVAQDVGVAGQELTAAGIV